MKGAKDSTVDNISNEKCIEANKFVRLFFKYSFDKILNDYALTCLEKLGIKIGEKSKTLQLFSF